MARDMEYLQTKRLEVLETIKPMCEAFGIKKYDYVVSETGQSEKLVIYDTEIGCSSNSISAIVQELVGWIFITQWRDRCLGAFQTQTTNVIKRYWIEKG